MSETNTATEKAKAIKAHILCCPYKICGDYGYVQVVETKPEQYCKRLEPCRLNCKYVMNFVKEAEKINDDTDCKTAKEKLLKLHIKFCPYKIGTGLSHSVKFSTKHKNTYCTRTKCNKMCEFVEYYKFNTTEPEQAKDQE